MLSRNPKGTQSEAAKHLVLAQRFFGSLRSPQNDTFEGDSMKRMNIVWGILLIGIGVITLMQTMGVIAGGLGYVWAFVFAAVGATFLWTFITDRSRWWALIPAFVLFSLAATAFMQSALPETSSRWTGAVFMGGLSLSFWAVYFVRRDYWWAIIPGGVLLTIAVVAAMPGSESVSGGIFFLGLALTFALVFLLTRMMWAIIPAAILALIGGALAIGQEV